MHVPRASLITRGPIGSAMNLQLAPPAAPWPALSPTFGLTASFQAQVASVLAQPRTERPALSATLHESGSRKAENPAKSLAKIGRALEAAKAKEGEALMASAASLNAHFDSAPTNDEEQILSKTAPSVRGTVEVGGQAISADIADEMTKLNTAGYAILPPETLMSKKTEQGILDAVYKHPSWLDFRADQTQANIWAFAGRQEENLGANADGTGGVKEFIGNLERTLRQTLPKENLVPDPAPRFILTKGKTQNTGSTIHIDNGSTDLTVSYAFEGPGTVIYDDSDVENTRKIRTPARATTIITNRHRSETKNIPGTIHAAPDEWSSKRIVLLLRFTERNPNELPQERSKNHQEGQSLRVRRVFDEVERTKRGLSASPRISDKDSFERSARTVERRTVRPSPILEQPHP